MEDYAIDIMIGRGASARSIHSGSGERIYTGGGRPGLQDFCLHLFVTVLVYDASSGFILMRSLRRSLSVLLRFLEWRLMRRVRLRLPRDPGDSEACQPSAEEGSMMILRR